MSLIHKHLVCGFGFQINIFLQVQFLGEEGQDGGGPSREFWGLLSKDIRSSLFEGNSDRCVIRHETTRLQKILIRKIKIPYFYCHRIIYK